MKQLRNYVFLASLSVVFLSVSACNRSGSSDSFAKSANYEVSQMESAVPPPPPGSSTTNQSNYNPKLIKTGNLTISSNAIEETRKTLYELVKACKGNISNEELVKSDFSTYYEIQLNVEATHFDEFLRLIDSVGLNIVSRSFSVEDISMRYIDDSTRSQNKKKLEQKYLYLLSKAADMRSTLDIEAKIEEIRTDIEVKEGQLKLLDKQVAYSDFSVRIETDNLNLSNSTRNKFTHRIGKGLSNGWYGLKEFLIFLVTIWPVYIVIAGFIYLIRYIIRRKRKNKK
jgi:hypothetical protein